MLSEQQTWCFVEPIIGGGHYADMMGRWGRMPWADKPGRKIPRLGLY